MKKNLIEKKSELTICIAAYNNNDSLIRAINSLRQQTIAKKLDVLISDDCSPNKINKNYLIKYQKYFNKFSFKRQTKNLGVLSNAEWLFNNCSTKYYTFLQHDDVLVDPSFYERVLNHFKNNKKLVVFYGNSIVLSSKFYSKENHKQILKKNKAMYDFEDKTIEGIKDDGSIPGDQFISNYVNEKVNLITSWSAIVFKRKPSILVGGFGGKYTLSKKEASALNIYREEEGGLIFFLLSLMGDFQLEKNPSLIRILEPTSFSTIRNHPARLMLQDGTLFSYYKLASFIESNLSSFLTDKIIKIIYYLMSNIPLEYESKYTKYFFKKYKLKNEKYHRLILQSLMKSSKLRSKFRFLKLAKRYLDYHIGLFQILRKIKRYLVFLRNLSLKIFLNPLNKTFSNKI